ncbi:hypothetical protein LL14B4_10550 [Lactococcus lactis subsp. lactis]|uniref:Uncharacterized protein n=1 Tax=Lactococcus lactis subsp. lactis TaxID=1360 RepID=A0A2Z3KIF9_LACLL|nr:hypothetical protein [Lactococcus lactis]AWN66591.1 hypothetical protein LL14B4_10550 [Lactococcus lactis subsp. lactis]
MRGLKAFLLYRHVRNYNEGLGHGSLRTIKDVEKINQSLCKIIRFIRKNPATDWAVLPEIWYEYYSNLPSRVPKYCKNVEEIFEWIGAVKIADSAIEVANEKSKEMKKISVYRYFDIKIAQNGKYFASSVELNAFLGFAKAFADISEAKDAIDEFWRKK